MSKQFPHLFTPGRIGNVEIKNRICKAPQTSGLSHMDGSVSERLVRYYEDLAKGEVGMIIVEYAYVDRLYTRWQRPDNHAAQISSSIPPICSTLSMTYTRKPNDRRSRCRAS